MVIAEVEPQCVAPVGDQCGEEATWSPAEKALYWTDVNRFLIHRMRLETLAVETWYFDEPCVALFLTNRPHVLIVAIGSRLIEWNPSNDSRSEVGFDLEGWPVVRLNDGRPGPGGEVWIGSMANNVGPEGTPGPVEGAAGKLFRWMPGAPPIVAKSGIGISNTVCFSPDRRYFYFGDTPRNTIGRFDYDATTKTISNETEFFTDFDRGLPDGSTIDADGYLWNCRFGGGCVVRIDPDGQIDRIIEMPVTNITTCEFGGPDLDTLFITTAAMMTPGFERLAGSLFSLRANVRGLPPLYVRLRE